MGSGQFGIDGLIVMPLVERASDLVKEDVIHQNLKMEGAIALVKNVPHIRVKSLYSPKFVEIILLNLCISLGSNIEVEKCQRGPTLCPSVSITNYVATFDLQMSYKKCSVGFAS